MTVYWMSGGTELIGQHLVQRLVQAKQQLVVLSRSAGTCFETHQLPGVLALDFDLARDCLQSLPDHGDDIVFIAVASHITDSCGFSRLGSVLQANTIGLLRLLEYMRPKLRHIVYTSSCTVYGQADQLPVSESAPFQPENVHALDRIATELLLQQVREQWGVPITILRIAQVYGPGSNLDSAMYRLLQQAHKGETTLIREPPDAICDYCHVSDVVNAILLAIREKADAVLNIGSGTPISLEELAKLCLSVAKCDKKPVVQLEPQARTTSMLLDISRAQALIGYDPKVGVRAGVVSEYLRLWENRSEFPYSSSSLACLGN